MLVVLAPPHAGFVHHDQKEPTLELFSRSQFIQVRKRFQKRLLSNFFGVCLVLQDGEGCQVNSPLVRTDKLMKKFLLPFTDTLDQSRCVTFDRIVESCQGIRCSHRAVASNLPSPSNDAQWDSWLQAGWAFAEPEGSTPKTGASGSTMQPWISASRLY